jgi:hypothetical protein
MMLTANPTSAQSPTAPGTARLELLAEIWARQTGRSIVISPGPSAHQAEEGAHLLHE